MATSSKAARMFYSYFFIPSYTLFGINGKQETHSYALVLNIRACVKYLLKIHENNSAIQSKNTVCAFIKHNRCFYLTHKLTSVHSHVEKIYIHISNIVDTAFN